VSAKPAIPKSVAIRFEVIRAQYRWQALASIKDLQTHAISHAYVLLSAVIGERLDLSLPVVEFAPLASLETAAKVNDANLLSALRCVLQNINEAHRLAMEIDRLADEYAKATAAHLALLTPKVKASKRRGVRYARRSAPDCKGEV
jgi:hypothetical protein